MSGKARQLAASLASLANSALLAKGAGYMVGVSDMYPLASRLVKLDKASARIDRQLARNGALLASMITPPGAADVERRATGAQLSRFVPFPVNGFDKHLPTTNGVADVPPNHPG